MSSDCPRVHHPYTPDCTIRHEVPDKSARVRQRSEIKKEKKPKILLRLRVVARAGWFLVERSRLRAHGGRGVADFGEPGEGLSRRAPRRERRL